MSSEFLKQSLRQTLFCLWMMLVLHHSLQPTGWSSWQPKAQRLQPFFLQFGGRARGSPWLGKESSAEGIVERGEASFLWQPGWVRAEVWGRPPRAPVAPPRHWGSCFLNEAQQTVSCDRVSPSVRNVSLRPHPDSLHTLSCSPPLLPAASWCFTSCRWTQIDFWERAVMSRFNLKCFHTLYSRCSHTQAWNVSAFTRMPGNNAETLPFSY